MFFTVNCSTALGGMRGISCQVHEDRKILPASYNKENLCTVFLHPCDICHEYSSRTAKGLRVHCVQGHKVGIVKERAVDSYGRPLDEDVTTSPYTLSPTFDSEYDEVTLKSDRMSKSSLEAAAEAAAKVNAMLIAKGKLKLSPSQIKPKIGNNFIHGRAKAPGDLVTAEVDINDAPLSARNLLTRGHMQDEICKFSGAAISTRGRYMTPEERQNIVTPECRPLYLNVQASNYDAIKVAVRRIQEIIDHEVLTSGVPKSPTVGVVTYPSNCTNGNVNSGFQTNHVPSGSHFVQDKVFVGLEQAPSEYPVREKILGPGGSFLQHIRTETGATVTLRGKGSGFIEPTSGREAFEPLYIHITHPKPEGLQAAKALAINLVETAHVEFAQWQQTQQQSVLQPLTSIVLPQAAPVAYQNQDLPSGSKHNNSPVLQPLTSIVLPQAAPVAYQNQRFVFNLK
ncbi:KH homology domain-containing protein 4 [Nephila pilipes]|uniref:KH homology domain-containing protein 4 n=1 Tax=Nephila pilipes TaxID=299642 RepID=A0A8X6KKM5_NEPPI|nr:KH homology domain-containing protein 4 [Nephila pilipes]